MNAANPLEPLGRAIGAMFDRFVTPALIGLALGVVTTGLFG